MLPSQTLPDFQQYLLSRKLVPEKNVTFNAYWANRYLTFSGRLKHADAAEALRLFLEDLQSGKTLPTGRSSKPKKPFSSTPPIFAGENRLELPTTKKNDLQPFRPGPNHDKPSGGDPCETLFA